MSGDAANELEPLIEAAERLVARSPADATLVSWVAGCRSQALYGDRGRRADSTAEREIAIRVRVAGRTGTARAGDAGAGGLEAALRSAMAAARASDPSPDWDAAAAAAPCAEPPGADPELAGLAPEAASAELARLAAPRSTLQLDWLEQRVIVAASFLPTRAARTTSITFTARTGRRPGSGFAAGSAPTRAGLALGELAERAVALEAGEVREETPAAPLPIVLAPEATAVLIEAFARAAFGARRALAGVPPPALAEPLDLGDEPLDPRGLPRAFDLDGCPCSARALVHRGRPAGAAFDLDLAARAGTAPTGHGLAADDAWPLHPAVAAGPHDEAELRAAAAGGLRVGTLERLAIAGDELLSVSMLARNLRRIEAGGALGEGLAPLVWRTSLAVLLGAVLEAGRHRIVWGVRAGLPGAVTCPALRLAPVGGFAPFRRAARG